MAQDSSAKRALIPKRGPQAPRFIAIEGPLRVGKSTLARILAERLHARRVYDCERQSLFDRLLQRKIGLRVSRANVFSAGTAKRFARKLWLPILPRRFLPIS